MNFSNFSNTIKKFMKKNDGFFIIGNYINGVSVSNCIKAGHQTALLLSEKA